MDDEAKTSELAAPDPVPNGTPAGAIPGGEAAGLEAALFGRVPAEDLAAYSPDDLSRLAERSLAHLSEPRRDGTASVQLRDATASGGEGVGPREGSVPRELTILEAVNDDRPFLLDSTLAALAERGLEPRLVAHPILTVRRDGSGRLLDFDGAAGGDGAAESLIHIHLDRLPAGGVRDALTGALEAAYRDVAAVARDAGTMRAQLAGLIEEYRTSPPPLPEGELDEALAFLEWLGEEHFTLLGLRAARMPDGNGSPEPLEGSGLGLLADPDMHLFKRAGAPVPVTPEIRAFMSEPKALMVLKASVRSRVLRRDYLDYVGAKLFSSGGRLWGELSIVGLFTGLAHAVPATETPLLRRKVADAVARAGYDPASFDGRSLLEALEEFPRDELFQIDDETLDRFALEILRLREHPRLRALARTDRYGRYLSVLVFLPRERDDAERRTRIGAYLASLYDGRVSAVYPGTAGPALTRTHYIIGHDGEIPTVERATLEAGIAAIVRSWGDRLADALAARLDGHAARELASRYANAFGAAYSAAFDADTALADIGRLEQLGERRPRAVSLERRPGDPPGRVNLRLFTRGTSLPLSERVPLLERLGFRVIDERTHRIRPGGGEGDASGSDDAIVYLHDMALERASGGAVEIDALAGRLEAALLAVLRGIADGDEFNKLVLEAGLGWREAALFRAFGRYLRQITFPFGQDYLADVLARHRDAVGHLLALFYARFDPRLAAEERAARTEAARAAVADALRAVTVLDEDRILRRFLNLIEAAVRTNFFQVGPDGLPRSIVAFKFSCPEVSALPKPRPLFEIFMNGPDVEALHLRFGHVARGGIRWTDRPQDFRTEILGLVKAQQVKNAVIVPVGAKGGFFPKRLPPASDRAAWLAEGTAAYRLFIGTLLDLTDNLDGDRVVPPADTVRHDGDDPYLVVAADKGTATFSDTANAIAVARGHWLGDAFASGGSNGYDHKAMGITARGAWEAVKRHFREMDVDIGTQPVTVAGVGDMSGDVFGNGMLLSRSMKLVAAFDHRDIFIDPDPDPAASFAERERLFALPRSSWADFDRSLISAGGGVFSRSLKAVPLSPEAQAALGVSVAEATPAEVMSAILRAPVGLLWFGGIGTYIRASTESDAAAGDRANDPVRIAGREVRAQVIGEGANLGVTQLGRIEAARAGVRLNTDAIDNSAGVNTSDVEVNIKVALATPERDGRLDPEGRNALLRAMTDEVGRLVLRNNYLQTLALSLSQRRGAGDLGFLSRLMSVQEASGRLDRAIEFLPDDAAIAERRQAGIGLTRPELSVLLAYAKLALHDELLASGVPDDPYLGRELERYFPAELRERFPDAVAGHRLRREIIATQLANAIVNRGGPAIITRLNDDTGADAATIAAAYAATRDSFDLPALHAGIDALDGLIGGARQLELYAEVQELTLSRMVWFIRNVDFKARPLDDVVGQYREGIEVVASGLPPEASAEADTRAAGLEREGVPSDLARSLARLPALFHAPDIVLVARRAEVPIGEAARVHAGLGAFFRLGALTEAALAIPVVDHYDRLARDRAVDAVATAQRRLAAEVIGRGGDLAAWEAARGAEPARIRDAVSATVASGLTVSKLTVAAALIADLAKD